MHDTVTVRLPVRLGVRGPATVRLALPLAPVQAQLRQMHRLLLLIGVAASVLALWIGLVFSRRIARPVEGMTELAERIAAGDFEAGGEVRGEDEIGRLAGSLDAMRRSLRDNLREITKERNQALAIVRNMSDGVISLAPRGEVVFANSAAEKMLGLSGSLAPGAKFGELPADEALGRTVRSVAESGRPDVVEFGDVTAGDRVIRVSVNPVTQEPPDQERGVVMVVRDMTEARRAEALGRELVANASHELRTPLSVISSTADTLLHSAGAGEGDQREFVEIIARHARRMEQLVKGTLQLSQLEAGATAGAPETLSVADLIRQTADLCAPRAAEKGLRLETNVPPESAVVRGVESLLLQALGNLADNAIRYTPPGGTVTIGASTAGGEVELSVADTGHGIPPAERSAVFERFVRGRQASASGVEGSGLGLAIVSRVVRLHNGRVDLESVAGKGSRFIVRLPAGE